MKNTYILLSLVLALSTKAVAQTGDNTFFDPEHDPIALKTDNTLQFIVSEFVLAKSVKAGIGQDCQVTGTYKTQLANGSEFLIFEGSYSAGVRQPFTLGIRLTPDAQGQYYYAGSQLRTMCSTPGCNTCGIDDNGKCIGCCTTPTSTDDAPALKKVSTSTN